MAQLDRWIISTFAYCAKNKDEKTNFQSRLPFVSPDTWATSSVGMLMCQSCKIKHSSRLIQTPVLFLAQKGKTSLLAIFLQTDFFLCRTLAKWVSTSKSMSITWHNEWCAFGETYLISFFSLSPLLLAEKLSYLLIGCSAHCINAFFWSHCVAFWCTRTLLKWVEEVHLD